MRNIRDRYISFYFDIRSIKNAIGNAIEISLLFLIGKLGVFGSDSNQHFFGV